MDSKKLQPGSVKKRQKNKEKCNDGKNCNPEVVEGKGELQILGFRDESQHIVMWITLARTIPFPV